MDGKPNTNSHKPFAKTYAGLNSENPTQFGRMDLENKRKITSARLTSFRSHVLEQLRQSSRLQRIARRLGMRIAADQLR